MARCLGVVLVLLWMGFSAEGQAQGGDGLEAPPQPAESPETNADPPIVEPVESPMSEDNGSRDSEPGETPAQPAQPAQLPLGEVPPPPPGYAPNAQQPAPYARPVYQSAPRFQLAPVDRRFRRTRRPRFVSYDEGDPIPRGTRLEDRRNRKLIIAGVAAFGGSYLASVLVATTGRRTSVFAIPFLGPIIWYVEEGDREILVPVGLVSIAQVVGVILFAVGMVKHPYIRVPADYEIALTPIISPTQVGLSLTLF